MFQATEFSSSPANLKTNDSDVVTLSSLKESITINANPRCVMAVDKRGCFGRFTPPPQQASDEKHAHHSTCDCDGDGSRRNIEYCNRGSGTREGYRRTHVRTLRCIARAISHNENAGLWWGRVPL